MIRRGRDRRSGDECADGWGSLEVCSGIGWRRGWEDDAGGACWRGVSKHGQRCRGTAMRCSTRRRTGPTRSACWRSRRRRGCRSWCRSGGAGCWSPRSPSTAARRCRWPATWPRPRSPGWRCRRAATRTCPTSASSARPSAAWSSTSTTSTRRCPARGSGTSSGWRPAWRWRRAATGSPARTAARSSRPRWPGTGRRCGPSPG